MSATHLQDALDTLKTTGVRIAPQRHAIFGISNSINGTSYCR